MAHILSESSKRLEPNQQDFFKTPSEQQELKNSEKLQFVVKAGFQSGALEVITSEQNNSTTFFSFNR